MPQLQGFHAELEKRVYTDRFFKPATGGDRMATVKLLQPTNMTEMPSTSGGGGNGQLGTTEVDAHTNNGVHMYLLGSFVLPGPVAEGTINRAMIDTLDSGEFPNLDITDLAFFSSDVFNQASINPSKFLTDLLSGDDTLLGSTGADTILAFAGNDTIHGGMGADIMFGGTGNDFYLSMISAIRSSSSLEKVQIACSPQPVGI
jgi:Ca2+-binding RTX toxin-like protein